MAQKDETINNLIGSLQKSSLVEKPVLVHGPHGTYWSTRRVNPDAGHPTSSGQHTRQQSQDSIQEIMANSTKEQQKLYTKTGICAEDSQSESFVKTVSQEMSQNHIVNRSHTVKSKISFVPPTSDEYKKIVQSIDSSWQQSRADEANQRKRSYKINGIYKISGLKNEATFQKIVKSHDKYSTKVHGGKNSQLDTFFHGTTLKGVGGILGVSGQLKILESEDGYNMFGKALYLAANSSYSSRYISQRGALLICDASLGNTWALPKDKEDDFDEWYDKNFDKLSDEIDRMESGTSQYSSLFAKVSNDVYRSSLPTYAVYNEDSVIPRYVVDMEITYKVNSPGGDTV